MAEGLRLVCAAHEGLCDLLRGCVWGILTFLVGVRACIRLFAEFALNVFDPWPRDRGEYYSLAWRARAGAQNDLAFADR